MRLGVYGGSFDPVHVGHLLMAEQCRETARLDQVLFIPAPRPPHKLDKEQTSFGKRVEMLELAIAGYPVFQVSLMEKDRPGPSYTVDTLRQLKTEHPSDELFLLVGSDCIPDLPQWRQPAQIAELARLVVATRPSWPLPQTLPEGFRFIIVQMPQVDISSTDLRARLEAGRSVRWFLPRAVECYIDAQRLYRAAHEDTPA